MAARIEQFLTGKATAQSPNALVLRMEDEHGHRFLRQIPGQPDVELGEESNGARRSSYALRDYIKAGGKTSKPTARTTRACSG
jgi:hypothetical protein